MVITAIKNKIISHNKLRIKKQKFYADMIRTKRNHTRPININSKHIYMVGLDRELVESASIIEDMKVNNINIYNDEVSPCVIGAITQYNSIVCLDTKATKHTKVVL